MPAMLRKLLRLAAWSAALALAAFLGPRAFTTLYTAPAVVSIEEAEQAQVAIVFGAALARNGRPSAVLRDRIQTAVDLYQAGQVDLLLMSGQVPEPASMRDYALELGVPAEAILLDELGLRTYDTCYRAVAVFQVESAILVTQAYHQARALYTCSQLGLPASGVPAQQSRYYRGALTIWNLREFLATGAALWDLHIAAPALTVEAARPISNMETGQ
jgi:SanA protein